MITIGRPLKICIQRTMDIGYSYLALSQWSMDIDIVLQSEDFDDGHALILPRLSGRKSEHVLNDTSARRTFLYSYEKKSLILNPNGFYGSPFDRSQQESDKQNVFFLNFKPKSPNRHNKVNLERHIGQTADITYMMMNANIIAPFAFGELFIYAIN